MIKRLREIVQARIDAAILPGWSGWPGSCLPL